MARDAELRRGARFAAASMGRLTRERERERLGLAGEPDSWLVSEPEGWPVPDERPARHLRFADTVRVSIEGNAEHCRALLAARYSEELGGAA